MGNDQRGFPRSLVELTVKTRIADQWIDSKVLDLSVEGLSLEVPQTSSGRVVHDWTGAQRMDEEKSGAGRGAALR